MLYLVIGSLLAALSRASNDTYHPMDELPTHFIQVHGFFVNMIPNNGWDNYNTTALGNYTDWNDLYHWNITLNISQGLYRHGKDDEVFEITSLNSPYNRTEMVYLDKKFLYNWTNVVQNCTVNMTVGSFDEDHVLNYTKNDSTTFECNKLVRNETI